MAWRRRVSLSVAHWLLGVPGAMEDRAAGASRNRDRPRPHHGGRVAQNSGSGTENMLVFPYKLRSHLPGDLEKVFLSLRRFWNITLGP